MEFSSKKDLSLLLHLFTYSFICLYQLDSWIFILFGGIISQYYNYFVLQTVTAVAIGVLSVWFLWLLTCTGIDFWVIPCCLAPDMLSQTCISERNSTCLWHVSLFIYCWIWLSNILRWKGSGCSYKWQHEVSLSWWPVLRLDCIKANVLIGILYYSFLRYYLLVIHGWYIGPLCSIS